MKISTLKKINRVLFFLYLFFASIALSFGDVDFDHSNGFDRMKEFSVSYQEQGTEQKIELLRKNYDRLKPSKAPSSSEPIIPKVIHQIWVGNNSIPANYLYYLETWKKFHPDWEFKLWREKDILAEKFETEDLFLKSRGMAEQADIARYEILRRYGGLYIDTDIQCFANFDELHHKYDFYVNMEPPGVNKKIVSIVNMMIGSVPEHPILTQTLKNIRTNWVETENYFENKFSNSWSSFARSTHNLAVLQTMHPFINAVFDFLQSDNLKYNKSIVLPAGYNVPIYLVNRYPLLNYLSRIIRGKPKVTNKIIIQPETMSFHFYDKNNSLLPEMSFAASLFNKNSFYSFFYRLMNLRNKYYLAFEDLFLKNSPNVISYRLKSTIPEVIYLENTNNMTEQEILLRKEAWQKHNPGYIVNLIDKSPLSYRFYLLKDMGGIYVDSSFNPCNLEEFQYKYDFYGLVKKNGLSSLALSTEIIAIKPGHSILRNLVEELENKSKLPNTPSDADINNVYLDRVYRYIQMDGKSIVLPKIYFKLKEKKID